VLNRPVKRDRSSSPALLLRPAPHPRRSPIRLFLLGEHAISREGLRLLLASESGFRVVGSATDWADAARARRSDVVVVDVPHASVPDRRALRALIAFCAPARVIILTSRLEHSRTMEALRLGVRGIVDKSVTAQLLFKSVRAVAAGEYWVERDIIADLTQRLHAWASPAADAPRQRPFGLTERELQIISLLIAGYGNKVIGDKCGIRERTVKQHLTNMFEKVGVSNRLELALFALHEHLVVTDDAGRPAPKLAR
jgi:two-component system nitrate/nitrite response regulator NarL